jgi:hypothetical protein
MLGSTSLQKLKNKTFKKTIESPNQRENERIPE